MRRPVAGSGVQQLRLAAARVVAFLNNMAAASVPGGVALAMVRAPRQQDGSVDATWDEAMAYGFLPDIQASWVPVAAAPQAATGDELNKLKGGTKAVKNIKQIHRRVHDQPSM